MRRILGAFAVTTVFLIGCRTMEDPENWNVAASDPILAVGHGAIVSAGGQEIEPSADFVIDAQRFYLKRLYEQANVQQKTDFKARQRRLQQVAPQTQAENMLVNAALVAWLLEVVSPSDAAHISSKNSALLGRFVRTADGEPSAKDSRAGSIRRELVELLRREKLVTFMSATDAAGAAYIEECRKAGVPIPPDWGNPNWISQGNVTTKFIGPDIGAELFTFESQSPRGVCMALPRWAGDSTNLLGIICLGTDSSKSCFWDNDHRGTKRIKKGESVPLRDFLGGADLDIPEQKAIGGICTDCHAGENPFVVHPGQPMDLGTKIVPEGWQQPLVHPSWPQNPGPNTTLLGITLIPDEDQSCLGCHNASKGMRFPEVSTALPFYCGIILESAISRTMPPTSPGVNDEFAKHIEALRESCRNSPPPGVVVNGETQSDPVPGGTDTTITVTSCAPGADCPTGFCFWRAVHGPFWQTSPSTMPVGDEKYRGSVLRLFTEGNQWKLSYLAKAGPGVSTPAPGGRYECINYNRIATVPDPKNCFGNIFSLSDPDGTHLSQSVDVTLPGFASAGLLTGFIGNVAQANLNVPDVLRVRDNAGKFLLEQRHDANPPSPLKPGPLTGECWTTGCTGWTPIFDAKDVLSTSDVQLVTPAQAKNVRCYITGLTGAWSSTRDGGKVQPFAKIYSGATGDVRLRVWPTEGQDRVGAYASCLRVK
jgi:hypothetical protein